MRTVTVGASRSGRSLVAIAALGSLASGCQPGPLIEGEIPSIGRDAKGDLTLIAGPCSSTELTAIAIVAVGDDGSEDPVLRIVFDPPMSASDVVVPLDPLDIDRPGFNVETLDELRFAETLGNTDDRYQVLTETFYTGDGSTDRQLDSFRPGLLPENTAFDYEKLIEKPARYYCDPGDNQPWRDVFEG